MKPISCPASPLPSSFLSSLPVLVRNGSLLVLALLLVIGCSSPPIPQDRYYRLSFDNQSSLDAGGNLFDGSVSVELPRAAGIRRQRAIIYSNDAEHLELKRHRYLRWEAPPSEMIQKRLLYRFRPLAKTTTDAAHANTDYRIQTTLHRFEREIEDSQVWAVVSMDFKVLPAKASGDPLLEGQYETRVQARGTDMIASARAFSTAVEQVIDQFLAEVRESPVP